jgi:hypothetical protein
MSMRRVDCKRWGMLCLKSLPAPFYERSGHFYLNGINYLGRSIKVRTLDPTISGAIVHRRIPTNPC